MQRNFRLIFNVFLFVSIIFDIILLSFITLDLVLNLKPSIMNMIILDLLVSLLIAINSFLNSIQLKNKSGYITKNWMDILAIIPLAYIMVYIAPDLSLLIIIILIVRIYALFRYMVKIRQAVKFTRKTKLDYATFILLLTLIFGSLFFFWAESPVNPQASSLDNSLFFIIVTMSTVGYGNIVPYTGVGKLIAVLAIIVGLGYTGWVTAAIASSLVEEFRKEGKDEIKRQNEVMEEILDRVNKIEKDFDEIKKEKNRL